MIRIQFNHDQEENITMFTMSGHAEAGPHGQDIVCAGASAVSIGAINAVHALCGVDLVVDLAGSEGGYLHCEVPENLDTKTYDDVQLLLKGMELSLQSMEESYRSFMSIETDRR
ncbi:ribosomal-processing cysteine protease Prp [Shouchella sp. 1P09AA]|uniref:ribosomal-processing cysteine protease Prp n=1 Tax=Bacillaceae TaxID=186817 RepID=UPI000C06B81B|nr:MULTISPECIES: ribosomal-processing cysteine protease Prp [Bacillaceae]UTR05081.1 ribosomal-processing cysteine protease Prp [Alkalihalobacillus sp. LMS6]